MAYTIERLKRVCDVFVKPPSKGSKATALADHAGPLQLYDFRPRVKDGNLRISLSCMDNDETEDYEPNEDRAPRKRKVRSNGTSQTSLRPSKKARNTSESSAALQRCLIEDALKEKQQRDDYLSSLPFNYNFRSRERLSEISGNAIDGLNTVANTEVSRDGASSVTPSSKACLACRDLELECTLEQNPFLYPCEDCRADKIDCILSPPPTWKRPCENCKSHRKGQHCSYYSGDYDHSKPCQFCQEHGFKCIAGPARHNPSAVQTDRSTGQATDESQTSQANTCSSATAVLDQSGRSSSANARAVPAPTYELVTTLGPGLPPVLAIASDSDSSPMAIRTNQSATDGKQSSPVQLGEPEEFFFLDDQIALLPRTALPPRIMDTIIHYVGYNPSDERKTYFVGTELPHPLKVMYDPSGPKSAPCHWCHNFAYGITGLGVRYPKVLELGDGKLIELRDGHTNEGIEPSRMCIQCTFKRVSIILCSHDQIAPLVDYSSNELDVDAIFDRLAEASTALDPKSKHVGQAFPEPDHPWCSLCREPAFWRCDSSHPYSGEQKSAIPTDPGCGLHLCDYCAHYTKLFHGDLDAVYEHGKDDPENETDFRADVRYLLKRSENNVFWHQVHGKE